MDLEKLRRQQGRIAGLMLTNPNTVGLFDKNILEITHIVHDCGGLCYYDGANLNAVMGMVRPGDMGFDVVHLNLHKTFSTPHGGGGPGSGPVGCKEILAEFLPSVRVVEGDGIRFESPKHWRGKELLWKFPGSRKGVDLYPDPWKGRHPGSQPECGAQCELYDERSEGLVYDGI